MFGPHSLFFIFNLTLQQNKKKLKIMKKTKTGLIWHTLSVTTEALKVMEKVAEHINEMQRIHEEYGAIFDHLFRQHQKSCKQVSGCLYTHPYCVRKPPFLKVCKMTNTFNRLCSSGCRNLSFLFHLFLFWFYFFIFNPSKSFYFMLWKFPQ